MPRYRNIGLFVPENAEGTQRGKFENEIEDDEERQNERIPAIGMHGGAVCAAGRGSGRNEQAHVRVWRNVTSKRY